MTYGQLIQRFPRLLAFGFLLTFFSGFGQTFFISLFSGPIRELFALSHGGYGQIYSLGTLASGLMMLWAGRRIDHFPLRPYTLAVCLGLVAAALLMAGVQAVWMLGLAIFALRLSCQGLFAHIAMTSMTRYFGTERGKATGLAAIGFPAAEAVFPILAVNALLWMDWRSTWLVIAGLALAVVLPVMMLLLRGQTQLDRATFLGKDQPADDQSTAAATDDQQWSYRRLLRDARFLLMLPAFLCVPFFNTGVFFHQVHLMDVKGWAPAAYASAFVGFSIGRILTSFGSGSLIDRSDTLRLMPYHLLPLLAALLVAGLSSHLAVAYLMLTAMGISTGAALPIFSAAWAEMYGIKSIGTIRALGSTIMVLSTALSPVLFGWLLDEGLSFGALFTGSAGVVALAMLPLFFLPAVQRRHTGGG